MKLTHRILTAASLLLTLSVVGACKDDTAPDSGAGGAGGAGGAAPDLSKMDQAASNYADIVLATYKDTLSAAQDLDAAVDDFVAAPTEKGLADCRKAWLAARPPYLQSEVFRFYGGPIDNPDDDFEGLLNSWPLDEAYIDYTVDDPSAGIINDTSVELTADELVGLNAKDGEKNIATGYHAVEFLLWGQDLSKTGPGDRKYTDYTDGKPNADRRGQYLKIVSQLIVDQLTTVVAAWEDGKDNYRKDFLATKSDEQLRRILTGMVTLSGFETGGERLQAAYDTGNQEDEHSCFSDNTDVDMIEDVRGVQNVYLGKYKTLAGDEIGDGVGIFTIIEGTDAALAKELKDRIATSLALANELEQPFDQGIALGNTEGRAKVLALITSLRTYQAKQLEKAFTEFGLSIPNPE
jgi:putative iron-regulated protein